MFTSFTVPQIILYAEISQYLVQCDIQRKGLYGGGLDLNWAQKLYIIRKNVQWLYDLDPSNETLPATSQYLYALCGKYGLEAQHRVNTGGGVSPISPSAAPASISFIVDGSTTVPTGGTGVTIPSFIGYNLLFNRNHIPQSLVDDGGTYYSWDKTTGTFGCVGAAVAGELFDLIPYV